MIKNIHLDPDATTRTLSRTLAAEMLLHCELFFVSLKSLLLYFIDAVYHHFGNASSQYHCT